MADNIEQIKSRLDIVDVISGYLKLQKSGVNFKARCPFHNEKTPSFYVSPERQIWHCFGCSSGGDIFGFIKEMEGVEFPEALRILASRAGIKLESFDPKTRDARVRLYEVCELAAKFFEKQLHGSTAGKKAFQYLCQRGLKVLTIHEFRLGFAHDDWQTLGTFLHNSGYTDQEIVDAGLIIRRNDRMYDRFRSRIIFPIFDVNDQIVGFTGRIFNTASDLTGPESLSREKEISENTEGQAKYINTPQTLIYDKSRVLYGLAKSKAPIRQADRCLLVEGNTDVLMSHQAGVRNVVATSGTSLTHEQLKLLKRFTKNLNFCFDADQAGAIATRRGIGLALNQDFTVTITQIQDPDCKDPADYVQKYGEKWAEAVTQAKPAIQFYFDRVHEQYDPSSVESKKSVVRVVGPLVKQLTSRIEKAHWISQLASLLRVKEDVVEADIATVHDDISVYSSTAQAQNHVQEKYPVKNVKQLPADMLSEALLSVVLKDVSLFKTKLAQIDYEFINLQITSVLQKIAKLSDKELKGSAHEYINNLIESTDTERDNMKIEFAYIRSQELWKDFSNSELYTEFEGLLHKIEQKGIQAQTADLEFDIRKAELTRDSAKVDELAVLVNKLNNRLAQLQKK